MPKKSTLKKKIKVNSKSAILQANTVNSRPLYITVLALWGLYVYFTLQTPDTSARVFNLTPQTLDLLRMTIAIPYLLIWLSAAYSYTKIKRYAKVIAPSIESKAFNYIARGILIMIFSLIISTLLSTIRSHVGESAQFRQLLTIIYNYALIWPYIYAFSLLFYSAHLLTREIPNIKITINKYLLYGIPFAAFTYLWLELIFTNQSRVIAVSDYIQPTYYLKDSLLILTIVIPALASWIIGLLAIIKLRMYYQKVKGTLYKRGLSSLVFGFAGIILASILLQALLSLGAVRLLDLGLEKLLGAIYLFLFIQVGGYVLLARGANNLTKIETV